MGQGPLGPMGKAPWAWARAGPGPNGQGPMGPGRTQAQWPGVPSEARCPGGIRGFFALAPISQLFGQLFGRVGQYLGQGRMVVGHACHVVHRAVEVHDCDHFVYQLAGLGTDDVGAE